MAKKKIVDMDATKRYGLFYSEASMALDIMYGREYLKNDIGNVVILHRIDALKSKNKANDIYGQTKPKDKVFLPPVPLNVMLQIASNDPDNDSGLRREMVGTMVFSVYLDELDEMGVEIRVGDIIEYNMSGTTSRYFEVVNAMNITDTSEQTMAGMRAFWKKVTCNHVLKDHVNLP